MSTIPATLDALLAIGETVLKPQGVQIIDGQPVTNLEADYLAVGFTGEAGEPAIVAERSRVQLSAEPDREEYDVGCEAASWSGDGDPKAVRDRIFGLVETLNDELVRDQTLGGVVMRARLSVVAFTQEQISSGAVATVQLNVSCDAFTD